MTDHFSATQRNIRRSRVVIMAAFLLNAGMNFLLLGVFSRLGGLQLVGQWASVNATLMTVLIFDIGVTNALTYRIGKETVAAALPLLRRLLALAALAIGLVALASVASYPLAGAEGAAIGVTVLAGLLQLCANWTISIRLGQHEQYWFNVKSILRVIVQSVLALAFYFLLPLAPILSFAFAQACAALADFLFARALTAKDRVRVAPAPIADLRDLVRGFGPLAMVQNALQPLFQMSIVGLAGATALGNFTLASRLPMVVSQAVGEALRALLPGLAGLAARGDGTATTQLLRDALVGQLVLIGPGMIALAVHAGLIYRFWLGTSSPELIAALLWLALGTFFTSVSAPFFWAVQAYGSAGRLSLLVAVRMPLTLVAGALVYQARGLDLGYAVVFALSLTIGAAQVLWLAEARHGLLRPVLAALRWGRITLFLLGVLALNLAMSAGIARLHVAAALTAVGVLNLLAIGGGILGMRKGRIFPGVKGG